MSKVTTEFVILQYQSGVESYSKFTTEVGLWDSEKYVFEKYLKKSDEILDVGCGTGRTTFHLHQLGYKKIQGVDLTPEMIERANELNKHFQVDIAFKAGDVREMDYQKEIFDVVIFSFNGLMSIPDSKEREKALIAINEVLKVGGLFIFTTHDRNKDANFFDFWKAQKTIWDNGEQNPELYEFGDLITTSKNEEREIFIHIPTEESIGNFLKKGGFEILETFYRSDKFDEPENVKKKSGPCRFWIAKKEKSIAEK